MTQPTTLTRFPDAARETDAGWDAWPPAWHRGTLVGFDLETTGTDPGTARIVTAAVVYCHPDGSIGARSRGWLVDPGVPIPQEATAVHGISTARARAEGTAAAVAVPQILAALERVWAAGLPLVVFNAAYDLSLLDCAARRHGLAGPAARDSWRAACIVDPLVIDREVDRYRRGKRTLQAAAAHYSVTATHAHSAQGDAEAACLLARAIAERHPMIGNADPAMLVRAQVNWAAGWASRFESYLRSCGAVAAAVDGSWPLRAA